MRRFTEMFADQLIELNEEFIQERVHNFGKVQKDSVLIENDVNELANKVQEFKRTVDVSLLEDIFNLQYSLFPILRKITYRENFLIRAVEVFKRLPNNYPIYRDEGKQDTTRSPITQLNIGNAVSYYTNKTKEAKAQRKKVIGNLDTMIENVFIKKDPIPEEVVRYIEPYRLTEFEEQFIVIMDSVLELDGDIIDVFIDETNMEIEDVEHLPNDFTQDALMRHFDNVDRTSEEDVNFVMNFYAGLLDESISDPSILKEDDWDDWEDDMDDIKSEISSNAKVVDKTEDDVDKLKKNGVTDAEKSKLSDKQQLLGKARKGLTKSAKSTVGIINKTISLKGEDIDETLSVKYKVLRFAISVAVIAGALVLPKGIIKKLTASIVATVAVGAYSLNRMEKTAGVLEAQLEYLQDKMNEEVDPDAKRQLNITYKEVEVEYNRLKKIMKTTKVSSSDY